MLVPKLASTLRGYDRAQFSRDAIKFIPHPLVIGFTSGIAVIIFSSEVRDFFGLRMGDVPVSFVAKWMAYALVGPAFAIAMLAAIESLLSAVVADGMIGGQHRSNMELVAQGTANITSALFGGIPATGASHCHGPRGRATDTVSPVTHHARRNGQRARRSSRTRSASD